MRRSIRYVAWLVIAIMAVVATTRPAGGEPPRSLPASDERPIQAVVGSDDTTAMPAAAVDVDLSALPRESAFDEEHATELRNAYASRLRSLEEIRDALGRGERLDAIRLDALLHDSREKEELSIRFERAYLDARERRLEAEERERRRLAAERAKADSAAMENPATAEPESDTAESMTQTETDENPREVHAFARLDLEDVRDARYPVTLANLLFEYEEYELARAAYSVASSPEGEFGVDWAHYRLALCDERLGRLEAAEAAYAAFANEHPESRWKALAELARQAVALERRIVADRIVFEDTSGMEKGEAR